MNWIQIFFGGLQDIPAENTFDLADDLADLRIALQIEKFMRKKEKRNE